MKSACLLLLAAAAAWSQPALPTYPNQYEGDWVARDFTFHTGETLAELRLHYISIGHPARDAAGHVTNAVLILHGTGGSGSPFLRDIFGGELFGPGQPLDAASHFIILPDGDRPREIQQALRRLCTRDSRTTIMRTWCAPSTGCCTTGCRWTTCGW